MLRTQTKPRTSNVRAKPNRRVCSANARRQSGGGAKGKDRQTTKRHKLTRKEIEGFLARKTRISEEAAQAVWRLLLSHMRRALVRGRPVALTNVGTLEPFVKAPTRYRHPGTGEMATTPRRKHVRFILSPSLKNDLRRVKRG